ncbi:MAG: hypothetical protein FWD62_09555 [Betaproteobacteria bacterium]|nr:hypothetical protein [Betaproteobacteria bacterium]
MNGEVQALPDVSNPEACIAWLAELNPTNVLETHTRLTEFLNHLLMQPPTPIQHLEIMEAARTTVEFVQTELSQRYAARPLPPLSAEEALLRSVLNLWSLMLRTYSLIAQRSALDPLFIERRPMLAQRRIHYHGDLILEYYRARREVPTGMWAELHRYYASAEDWHVATVRVAEPLNETWRAQSCVEAYISLLLVDAANPYGRTPREFVWILRWAQRFAPHCNLYKDVNLTAKSSYAIDLAQDAGLRPVGTVAPVPSLRRVDSERLAAHIQAIVSQFKRGTAPAALGLGEDCVQPACARLLVSLYRPWGLAAAGRRFPRKHAKGTIEMATDLPSIGYFISGRPFEQPSRVRTGTYRDAAAVFTFGEQVEAAQPTEAEIYARAPQFGMSFEEWKIEDQSVSGFRISREVQGSRIDHRQLLALHPGDGESFILAEISWLMYHNDGRLFAGLSLMPGKPEMVAVRLQNPKGGGGLRENYQQAFLLPAVSALKSEPTLVLPAGWYHADRILEVCGDEENFQVRLVKLTSRGTNFDRAVFARIV